MILRVAAFAIAAFPAQLKAQGAAAALTKFLSLDAIAKPIGDLITKLSDRLLNATTGPELAKSRLKLLYRELLTMKEVRARYMVALKAYSRGHPRTPQKAELLRQAIHELERTSRDLTEVLHRIEVELDILSPETIRTIEGYQTPAAAQHQILDLFEQIGDANIDWPQLLKLADSNSRAIDKAIDSMRKFMKKQYPDLEKLTD